MRLVPRVDALRAIVSCRGFACTTYQVSGAGRSAGFMARLHFLPQRLYFRLQGLVFCLFAGEIGAGQANPFSTDNERHFRPVTGLSVENWRR